MLEEFTEEIEGHITLGSIRVMQQNEYKVLIKDNAHVWLVFGELTLLSCGLPLLIGLLFKF